MTVDMRARDRFVTLNGLRFHYRDWGDERAPPLLALHGLTGHARMWDTFAGAMADRFRVLALDQRGHGETQWADDYATARMVGDLEAFTRALDARPFALVGHSMGALNSYMYAARYPEAVARLVLVEFGPDGTFSAGADRAKATLLAAQRAVFDDPDALMQAARARNEWRPEDELRRQVLPNLVQRADGRWVWRYDAAGLTAFNDQAPTEADQWAALARIACPTLVVRGAESEGLRRVTAERMASAIPHGRLVEVPRSGHGVPFDDPPGFLAAVRPFLLAGPAVAGGD